MYSRKLQTRLAIVSSLLNLVVIYCWGLSVFDTNEMILKCEKDPTLLTSFHRLTSGTGVFFYVLFFFMVDGNLSLSALVSWRNCKLCVFLNSNRRKHAVRSVTHFQYRRICEGWTSGILLCICDLIKQNRKSLLRSFRAV